MLVGITLGKIGLYAKFVISGVPCREYLSYR